MAFVTAKWLNTAYGDWEHYEYPSINLVYRDGSVHSLVAWGERGTDSAPWFYRLGFIYRCDHEITTMSEFWEKIATKQACENVMFGAKLYRNNSVRATIDHWDNTITYHVYNATKKIGILALEGWSANNQQVAVVSDWSPRELYVTYVGNPGANPTGTWNKAEELADGFFPWIEDNSKTGGGKGNWYDNQTDPIGLPDLTTLNSQSFANTLFVSTYRLTNSEVQALGREFWKSSFIEQIIQKFENPMDSIISLSMIPVDSVGSAKEIIIGGYRTGISSHLIGNQFVKLPCGSVEIPEKWGGAIDYHSGISVYLPFIGVEQLDPQECIGATIAVNYYIDIITGACIAFVKITRGELNSVLYHFTGNCSYSLPLTKQDYTAIFNAIVGASATAIGTVASGGSGIMASVAIGSNMLTSAETHTAHSGSMGGNTGIMGVKKPYIILSRPIQSLPADFGSFRGYPSNITETLSSLKGFTKVKEIHLENIGATDAEKAEIEQLLKSGVIIK